MNYIMGIASFIPCVWHAGKAFALSKLYLPNDRQYEMVRDQPGLEFFLEGTQIRRDVKLIPTENEFFPEAFGSPTSWNAAIRVHKKMLEIEPAGTRYLLKAELYKIHANICVKDETIKAIGTLFTAICCLLEASETGRILPLTALMGVEFMMDYCFTRSWEEKARRFALKASTNEELLGALHIFEALRKAKEADTLPREGKVVKEELEARNSTNFTYNVAKIADLVRTINSIPSRVF